LSVFSIDLLPRFAIDRFPIGVSVKGYLLPELAVQKNKRAARRTPIGGV